MIRSLIARAAAALALVSLALAPAAPAVAQTASQITVKDGTGAATAMGAGTANGKLFYGFYGVDANGAPFVLPSAVQLPATLGPKPQAQALPVALSTDGPVGQQGDAAATTVDATPTSLIAQAKQQSVFQKAVAGTVGSDGTPAGTAQTIQPSASSKFDTVVRSTSTDIGASVTASTSITLAAANANRRGFSIQNQTTSNCWLSGLATATADFHSLLIPAGNYYESKDSHVGTGALSLICTQAGNVYGRQW